MEAKELRIGNLISGNYQIVEIDRVGCLVVDANNPDDSASEIYIDFNNINPIPLTEEWLLKFGFNQFAGQLMLRRFTYDSNQRRFEIEGFEYDFNGITASPQYVHQLQNLYFALTGEELTIKL